MNSREEVIEKITEERPSFKFKSMDDEKIIFEDSRKDQLHIYYEINEENNYEIVNIEEYVVPMKCDRIHW